MNKDSIGIVFHHDLDYVPSEGLDVGTDVGVDVGIDVGLYDVGLCGLRVGRLVLEHWSPLSHVFGYGKVQLCLYRICSCLL